MQLNLKKPLAFIDVQTTGTSVTQDRIVEIAIQVLTPNGANTTYHRLLNPERNIPRKATDVHGITDNDVACAKTFQECAKEICEFIGNADIAGYNIRSFHLPMLMESFHRAQFEWLVDDRCIVDAQNIFHLMERRDLESANRFYCNTPLPHVRRSIAHVLACADILKAQIERYRGQIIRDTTGKPLGQIDNDVTVLHSMFQSNALDYAGKLVYDENGDVTLNFGKYKGKQITTVDREDPQYIRWILKCSDFPYDTKKRLQKVVVENSNRLGNNQNLGNTEDAATKISENYFGGLENDENTSTTSKLFNIPVPKCRESIKTTPTFSFPSLAVNNNA